MSPADSNTPTLARYNLFSWHFPPVLFLCLGFLVKIHVICRRRLVSQKCRTCGMKANAQNKGFKCLKPQEDEYQWQCFSSCSPTAGLQQGHWGEMALMRGFVLCLQQAEPCLCWLLSDSSGAGSNKSSWSGCRSCWGCFFSHGSRAILHAAGDMDSVQLQKPALAHLCLLTSLQSPQTADNTGNSTR